MDEFSYFDLGSGLPLAGATVQIVGSQFIIDTTYASATVWSGTMQPVAATEGEALEAQRQLYSVGGKFEVADFGQRVMHQSGRDVRINNQSNYGKWIAACMSCEGAAEFLAEARARQMEPNRAELWLGMWFELGTQDYKAMNWKEGDDLKQLIVPIKYLGSSEVVGGAVQQQVAQVTPGGRPGGVPAGVPASAPAATPAARPGPGAPATPASALAGGPPAAGRTMPPRPGTPATAATNSPPPTPAASAPVPPSAPSAPPATPQAVFSGVIDGVPDEWTQWVVGVAQANTDFNTFIESVMAQPEVADFPGIQKAIMSGKEGSLWAAHHG